MFRKSVLIPLGISIAVIGTGIIGYFVLRNSETDIINIKLIDAFSGQPISHTKVTIYSDNGLRCITAPCNTEGRNWTGRSDNSGVVSIPFKVVNTVTTITAVGYTSGKDLNRDSRKNDNDNWLMELMPDKR